MGLESRNSPGPLTRVIVYWRGAENSDSEKEYTDHECARCTQRYTQLTAVLMLCFPNL
jgi:hypothetical protein